MRAMPTKPEILRWSYGALAWVCLFTYIIGGAYLWANRTMPTDPDRKAVEVVQR